MPTKGLEFNRFDSLCALCRKNEADEVGSHLAPNFIIHGAFSYDSKGKRDHEIAYLDRMYEPRQAFYGRNVSPEAINCDIGHDMTDEEVDANVNHLVYDHLFCKDCEKRFGILETEYAKFYNDGKDISPRVAYLFWMSVFWRMSRGYMALGMHIDDELKMRRILDREVSTIKDIENSDSELGGYGYVVFRCREVRKGDSGIFGTRGMKLPYVIIVNDLVVALVDDSLDKHLVAYKPVSRNDVNSWGDEDIWVEDISLEQFARMKRWIIDENIRNGYGPDSEKFSSEAKEHCHADDSPDFWYDNEEYIEMLNASEKGTKVKGTQLRNVYRFYAAELKQHAAKRAGREYDFLKDRSLMLFPFDVANYRNDLMEMARKGNCVKYLPMAAKLLKPKYLFDDPEGDDESKAIDYEEIIDKILSDGFTLDDIIDRNCCSKEGETNA